MALDTQQKSAELAARLDRLPFSKWHEVPVALTLTAEFSPARIRGRMAGSMAASFPVGLALAAIVALLIMPTWGWRAVFVAGVVPAVLLFFVRIYMPEVSPLSYHPRSGRRSRAHRGRDREEGRRRPAASAGARQSCSARRCRPRRHRGATAHAGAAQTHDPALDRVILFPVVVERHHLHVADHPDAARPAADADPGAAFGAGTGRHRWLHRVLVPDRSLRLAAARGRC